jgi:hypothetical protein
MRLGGGGMSRFGTKTGPGSSGTSIFQPPRAEALDADNHPRRLQESNPAPRANTAELID